MRRIGSVIGVDLEKLEEYKRLHAAVWPKVIEMIKECNIRNYSIYYRNGVCFGYYEYVGEDYEADMAKMAADPVTREWWKLCGPCQKPYPDREPGEWWAEMEELFHCD